MGNYFLKLKNIFL